MNDRFFDLKKEKQDRMINAALKIFALNGYKNSSTDDIVKQARISKGLLFHYFDSKLGLYSFLYSYSVRYFFMEIEGTVGKEERDFFKLYHGIEQAKFMVLRNYPYMKLFLDRAETETVSEALLATQDNRLQYRQWKEELEKRADMSFAGSEADAEKLQKMVRYTMMGIMTTHLQDQSFQAEMMLEEDLSYLEFVKRLYR